MGAKQKRTVLFSSFDNSSLAGSWHQWTSYTICIILGWMNSVERLTLLDPNFIWPALVAC